MKKLIILILVISSCLTVNSQSWQWFSTIGGGGGLGQDHPDEQVFDMKVDNDGNVYTCGRMLNSAYISDTIFMTFFGGYDIFIAKYNCHGDLLWYKTAGSNGFGDEGTGIILDNQNNVYLTGRVESSVFFGPCNLFGNILGDLVDMFLCKFDANGNLIWYKVGGTQLNQLVTYPKEIKFDKDSNLAVMYTSYISGYVFPGFYTYPGVSIGTFARSNGNMVKNFFLATSNFAYNGFTIDNKNNYTVLGAMSTDSILINNQPIYHYNSDINLPEMFIFKVDSLGNNVWIKHYGDSINRHWIDAGGISGDSLGNLYVSGTIDNGTNFDGHISFNPGNSMFPLANYPFLAKLDSNGAALWLTNPSCQRSAEIRHGVTLMHNGHILFTGIYSGLGIFGDSTFTSQVPFDMFLSEVSDSGTIINAENFSTSGFNEQINVITVDANDQIYVGGAFDGTLTLGNQTHTMVGGNGDGFIAKLGSICTVGINELNKNPETLQIYPNPSSEIITINYLKTENASIEIYDAIGKLILKQQVINTSGQTIINISNYPQGIYIVRLLSKQKQINSKFIKE